MNVEANDTDALLDQAKAHDQEALGELLNRHAGRLRCMLRLRLDRRLQGRVDISDVIQETFVEVLKSFEDYRRQPETSFFVWLRCLAGRRLMDLHRFHLGAQARDARREISLDRGVCPEASSAALAAQLVGGITSPSEAAMRAERRAKIQEALEQMDPLDREVLALRHFEQLTHSETAEVLGIQEAAASKRHLRALKRLKEILKTT